MHRVAILSFNNVALFELGCAVELFGLARPEFDSWYRGEVITLTTETIFSTAGLQLLPRHIQSLQEYDLLVVPSWPTDGRKVPEPIAQETQKFYKAKKRIISFCTGAFLLADLGLLNGRKATTHWKYADIFKSRFPDVEYVADVLYQYDGTLGCSAGSSAAIDLGLEVIRHDFGYRVANQVARRLVISAHRKGGQTQYAETPVQKNPGHFAAALDWAMQNLQKPIDIAMLADKANMSRRTFDRKFRTDFNMPPKEWLTHQRIHLAKNLLENKTLNIELIAEQAGFENATTMRHHFRKNLGISPSQFREQFHRKVLR
jgi:AraC family transcriptional regulator, transcriptional activator FtrA